MGVYWLCHYPETSRKNGIVERDGIAGFGASSSGGDTPERDQDLESHYQEVSPRNGIVEVGASSSGGNTSVRDQVLAREREFDEASAIENSTIRDVNPIDNSIFGLPDDFIQKMEEMWADVERDESLAYPLETALLRLLGRVAAVEERLHEENVAADTNIESNESM